MKFDWKYFFGFTKIKAVLLFLIALISLWFANNFCLVNSMLGATTDYLCILIIFLPVFLLGYLLLSIIFYFNKDKKYLKMAIGIIIVLIIFWIIFGL